GMDLKLRRTLSRRKRARQESIIVQIPQEVYDQLDLIHFSDIYAHTGDPRGGDYLMYSVLGFGATCNPPEETDEMRLLEYHFQYRTTSSQEEEADRETVRLVSSLGLNDDSKSVYDKIKAIHDYISENVEYGYDTYYGVRDDYPETYTGYGALINHLAVCQGYSSMFYRLCLEAGIDARVITSDSLGHAWNIVEIDNIYYLIDCTWDENGNTDTYFLRGVKDFFDHKNADDNFQDAGFASRYLLSEFKYGFEIKILGKAPDFTLITADRRTISTAAQNGRAKALIFFKEDCPNAQLTLNSLRGKEFDGIDFVYVYMCSSSEDQKTALSRIGSEFPTDLPGTYAVCANGYDALCSIEGITGTRDPEGWIYSTTVFFIDPENNIIFEEKGFGGDLSDLLESILEDSSIPPAPGQGADEYAGFTAIGNCGQNAVWRLYEDGTLRISGSGQLYDNGSPYSSIGWLSDEKTEENSYSCENIQAADIKKVIVDEGITYIGWEMFSDCSNLQSIDFYGHAPEFYWYQPLDHDIKVYFPENDASWNNVDKSIFSEGTKWISRDASGTHHHKWSSWKTTKAATIQAEGSKERSCTECGKKETAVIARLPKIAVSTLSVTFSSSIVYTGKALTPAPTVKAGSTVLKAGTDYTVSSYKNNINAGTATATLTGKGNYTGTRSVTFKINKAAQSISAKSSAASVAVGKTATVTITGNKGTKSYKSSNTAVATVNSSGVVTAKKVGTVTITAASASTSNYNAASKTLTIKVVPAATASLTASNLATGIKLSWKAVTGANGYKLYRNSTLVKTITSGSTVTFTDTKANTNGTKYIYKVVAKASTGDSTLSKSQTVYRVARPAISSATNSAASKMTVKWGKNATATSYEIQYSTSKTFASGNKTVTAAGASTVSKVIAGLTKGKTYYVRIRACKTVNNVKYISAWSATKSLKIIK
ncbi:MAG: transglutaminase domain-containing protein, partial [Eubacteriales bacterium]|nr:transglutaminase domain-containing protein [Eubacteriales bacterium]